MNKIEEKLLLVKKECLSDIAKRLSGRSDLRYPLYYSLEKNSDCDVRLFVFTYRWLDTQPNGKLVGILDYEDKLLNADYERVCNSLIQYARLIAFH